MASIFLLDAKYFQTFVKQEICVMKGYGLTETTGPVTRAVTQQELLRWGSTGRLVSNAEAKIIDPKTGIDLPPLKQGELWVRGPTVMQGNGVKYNIVRQAALL